MILMAFMLVFGNCVNCNIFFGFNPVCVPSIRVNGKREPLCLECFEKWNRIHRTDKGLDPIPLNPNAYYPHKEIEG